MKAAVYALLLIPLTMTAQVPQQRIVPLEEQIRAELDASPYHLGPIRLLPRFALNDAGYNNNLFGTPEPTVTDWTASVMAGVHMTVPLGTKMYLRGDALPQYYWYAHHVDERVFGGQYNGSWLAFFNKMSAGISGGTSKFVSNLSSENEFFVTQDTDAVGANFEVNLTPRWSVYAGGTGQHLNFTGQGPSVSAESIENLDRDEASVRAGMRYHWTAFFDVAAGVEGTQANFDRVQAAQTSDNRTKAFLVGLFYNRDRFFLNLSGGYRSGDPHHGSSYPSFSNGTGSYFVSYFLSQPLELQAYGHRGTQYSTFEGNAYYLETQNGIGVKIAISYRVILNAYGEYGTNVYPVAVPLGTDLVKRSDDYWTVGGGLTFLFFRNAAVTALASERKITSNFPGIDRSIFRFTTSVTFQGAITR